MIHLYKTIELHNLTISNKLLVETGARDIHCRLLDLGIRHLTCYGALPYQFVKTLFLSPAIYGGGRHICRTDSLVSLLRTLRLSVELSRLAILVAPQLTNLLLAAIDAQGREVD